MLHNLNEYKYSRERRRFGRQCDFSDHNQYMFNIQPSIQRRMNYVLRNPIDRATQLSSQFAYSEVETENPEFTEHGMFHYEGGWPKEVNMHDEEATLRYRKKIEREDEWGPQVLHLIEQSVEAAKQNSAVNIYDDFFVDFPPEYGMGIRKDFEARACNIFHDPIRPSRRANFIDWCPTDQNAFLMQHMDTIAAGQREPEENVAAEAAPDPGAGGDASAAITTEQPVVLPTISDNAFFIWDLENPLKPKIFLDGKENVTRAMFCPKDDNYIAGGYQTGTVCIWDAKNGGMPLDVTPLETSHRAEPVTAVCWVHCKTNTEFYTGSTDGAVKYWDYREMSSPTQEVLLDPTGTDEQRRDRAHGVAVLEFEYTIPVRYIIGSDHGHIFIGNRKGMMPTDMLPNNYKLLMGPIRTVERNPFFVKNFLITGDWMAKIWAEECKGYPSTFYVKKKNEILCGTWSTARCSMFVTGDNQGVLDFWDLLLHQREPIFSMKFNSPIVHAKFRPDSEHLAIALESGDVYLLELDEAMKQSRPIDKPLIAALFEREQLRSRLLEGRVEEIKLKYGRSAKAFDQEVEAGLDEGEAEGEDVGEGEIEIPFKDEEVLDPNDPMQFLQLVERDLEFKDVIQNFKETIFALDKKRQERQYRMERTDFEEIYDRLEQERAALAAEQELQEPELRSLSPPPPPPPPPAKKGKGKKGRQSTIGA